MRARAGVSPLVPPFKGSVSRHVVSAESLLEVCSNAPYVQACWERARAGEWPCIYVAPGANKKPADVLEFPGSEREADEADGAAEDVDRGHESRALGRGRDLLDRWRLSRRLIQHAERYSESQNGALPSPTESRVLHRFALHLAWVGRQIVPDMYQLAVAARGAIDDRFARDMLKFAAHWPWAPADGDGIQLSAEDLGMGSRLVTLRPRIDRLAKRQALVRVLQQVSDQLEMSPFSICSHTPEDEIIEALGRELSRVGGARASRSGRQSVPFSGSLLDGLDVRETLRHWVVEKRPWVREETRSSADVGAVVLIFDDDAADYPWREVWYGEHDQESDMAFFANDPDDAVVAPGIRRSQYGGLLLTWPPRRLGDVWHDPAYAFCRDPAETLLVAALDYSQEPLVVHVSNRPPRAQVRGLARRLGRKIVHLPPGVLPRDTLRKARVFHVLAGSHLRPIAEQLID